MLRILWHFTLGGEGGSLQRASVFLPLQEAEENGFIRKVIVLLLVPFKE